MIIDKELIQKCIKYRDWLELDGKISMYYQFKQELKEADNYNDFLHNIAELYILAYSMYEREISIDYVSFEEIIAQELVENLDNLVDKKNKEEKGGWDLLDDTIILKIENILNRNEK